MRRALEVADVFRRHGAAYRAAHAGHLSRGQRRVMARHRGLPHGGAGRSRRAVRPTAARSASPTTPAATGTAPSARGWRAPRGWRTGGPNCCRCRTSTSSSPCRRRSPRSPCRTRRVVYGMLFRAAAETLRIIAADPKHLGAEIGLIAVLHTWGQNLHAPPACALRRARRRALCRRHALGRLPAGLLPAGAGARRVSTAGCSSTACRRPSMPGSSRFFGTLASLAEPAAFAACLRRCAASSGWSTPSARSADPNRCSIISAATPTVSPSPTAAWSPATRPGHASAGRTTPPRQAQGDDARRRRVHPPLPAARPARRLSPHPPLRLPGQRPAVPPSSPVPRCWPPPSRRRRPWPAITASAMRCSPGVRSTLCPCCGGRMVEIAHVPTAAPRAPMRQLMKRCPVGLIDSRLQRHCICLLGGPRSSSLFSRPLAATDVRVPAIARCPSSAVGMPPTTPSPPSVSAVDRGHNDELSSAHSP